MRNKYVCVKNIVGGESIIVFPEIIEHRDFVEGFGRHIVSAGFIEMDTYNCHGRSIGLGIPSRGEIDTNIAIRQFVERE
ncbi:hypothetical protein FDI40_gp104 [Agrobacterium phage Atu_ph07]|uniref:Uncharacterized protein n=1 Tax=Agrobacterium phage Atu_ph07 TaxID=2024264 RepID=A0A2L0UZE9_9CAUD|nr:hypothetical protein FDI40_gp104 [Agrobacterium phage Atu_ph07]AUZ94905.1 hypothetical protein [Agrobacterium phage Atu_ph07]